MIPTKEQEIRHNLEALKSMLGARFNPLEAKYELKLDENTWVLHVSLQGTKDVMYVSVRLMIYQFDINSDQIIKRYCDDLYAALEKMILKRGIETLMK